MHVATIDLFAKHSDELKNLCLPVVHNIFHDSNALAKLLDEKNCLIKRINNSFFLLIPRHDYYYDMLYMSTDRENLCDSLNIFLNEYDADYQFRASIIGHDTSAGELADIFLKCGFTLGRKIARMRNLNDKNNIESVTERLCDDSKYHVEFAVEGDQQEIFNLLMTEFDLRSDNVPEISEIYENIIKKQTVVIRNEEGKIIALHYFTQQNSCAYGWYDVIVKKYRKHHLYSYMMLFLYEYWSEKNKVTRSYSWRDVANKRLMKLARHCNQLPDGVYIYNMLYTPEKVIRLNHTGA